MVCPNCSAAKDASLNLCSSVVGFFIEMLIIMPLQMREKYPFKTGLSCLVNRQTPPICWMGYRCIRINNVFVDYSNY